jgi:hypothetical protein
MVKRSKSTTIRSLKRDFNALAEAHAQLLARMQLNMEELVDRTNKLDSRLARLEASPFTENKELYERKRHALAEGSPGVPLFAD